MPFPSDPRFLVLHVVRLKGVATATAVTVAGGFSAGEAERLLHDLAASGLVEHRQRTLPGWVLTPVGRKQHETLMAEELEASAAQQAIEAAYRDFLAINPELLGACTAWQRRGHSADQPANDQSHPGDDQAVVERLVAVHRRAQPVLADLGSALLRYCAYGPRLQGALDRVVAGDADWFTRPLIDSYHSVWFELHQDMLDTLGIERGTEGQA